MKARAAACGGLACAALALAPAHAADDSGMLYSGTLETWFYDTVQQRQAPSLLNPANAVAHLPGTQQTGEARAQVQGKSDALDFTLRLRSVAQRNGDEGAGNADATVTDTYFSQAYARARLPGGWSASAGRMLLTWGPGNLRSPSNPFYYDAGRTQPLRELSGLDAASLLYSTSAYTLQAIHVLASGHTSGSQAENFSGSQTGAIRYNGNDVLKFDTHADTWLASAILSQQPGNTPYAGSYAQWTVNDAWLLYGEAGSGRRPYALAPGAAASALPLVTSRPSPRATTALGGASYTLENGQTFNLEYLYDGHGYTRGEEARYFLAAGNAAALPGAPASGPGAAILGQAAGTAPVLLARDYLAAIWQSNPQDSTLYWRGMWTGNLADHSAQWTGYVEKNINKRTSLFASVTVNTGSAGSEFPTLLRHTLTVGVKLFIF
jgi:hypothetical protein